MKNNNWMGFKWIAMSWGISVLGLSAILPKNCLNDFGMLAPDREITGGGVSREQLLHTTDRILNHAPTKVADGLLEIFDDHETYFENPAHLNALDRREKLLGRKVFDGWTEDIVDHVDSSPQLQRVAFLMAARGNIKDLVWTEGEDGRSDLEKMGVKPERLMNLVPPEVSMAALRRAQAAGVVKDAVIDNKLEIATGHRLQKFLTEPLPGLVYSDELARVLTEELQKNIQNVGAAHPKAQVAQEILTKLILHTQQGDYRFSLSGRNVASLKGGNDAGDCTQCAGVNNWTNGTWNSTFENIEMQVAVKGKFFARILAIAGESEGKPTLFAHAIEFNPQVRKQVEKNKKSISEVQKQHLKTAFDFFKKHAAAAGFQSVLVTDISNSADYSRFLKSVLPPEEKNLVKTSFSLLNSLSSSYRIAALASPKPLERALKIYLQGWDGPTTFPPILGEEYKPVHRTAVIASREMDRHSVEKASHILFDLYSVEYSRFRKSLKPALAITKDQWREFPAEKGIVMKKKATAHVAEISRQLKRILESNTVTAQREPALAELESLEFQVSTAFAKKDSLPLRSLMERLDSTISFEITQNVILGMDHLFLWDTPVSDRADYVKALVSLFGPPFLEQVKASFIQAQLPEAEVDWLTTHPLELLKFFHDQSSDEDMEDAPSLQSKLQVFRLRF